MTRVQPLADVREATPHSPGLMQVLESALAAPVVAGSPDTANATYVLELLDRGARLCVDGTAAALVTAPVQKKHHQRDRNPVQRPHGVPR